MPFDQSVITSVDPPRAVGGELYLSWESSAPAGTPFQVYVGGRLAYAGQRASCYVRMPRPSEAPARIDVGAVLPSEATADLSSELSPAPDNRAELTWWGGGWMSPDLAGFYVYGQSEPGGAVDYSSPLATIAAYPGGIETDGWGLGPWGIGGWGYAATAYSYESAPLYSGDWTFAVSAFDRQGNEGPRDLRQVPIRVPPREPPPFGTTNTRLQYSVVPDRGFPVVTIWWNASPG